MASANVVQGVLTTFRRKKSMTVGRQYGRNIGVSPLLVVEGLEAVTGSLMHASLTAQSKAITATNKASFAIQEAQWNSAPVLSGETRGSIENTVDWGGEGYMRSVGPTWFVSRFLVFGTVKMSPKWDLFGASQPHINAWLEAMEDAARVP
jgi:hypothetical protein